MCHLANVLEIHWSREIAQCELVHSYGLMQVHKLWSDQERYLNNTYYYCCILCNATHGIIMEAIIIAYFNFHQEYCTLACSINGCLPWNGYNQLLYSLRYIIMFALTIIYYYIIIIKNYIIYWPYCHIVMTLLIANCKF